MTATVCLMAWLLAQGEVGHGEMVEEPAPPGAAPLSGAEALAPLQREDSSRELVIVSESDCPSSAAVRSALERLRPAAEWPAAVVAIRPTDHGITVDVGSKNPVPRELAVGPDCARRATSAALVIVTWMNDLPAEVTGAPLLSTPDVVTDAPSAPLRPAASARYEVGAGLAAALGGGLAPASRAEILRLPARGMLGWQASLDVVGPREVAVGLGTTHWMRASAAVGPQVRHSNERFFVAADLGLAGGITSAWGSGYTGNGNDQSWIWGLAAGVRAGIPWRRFRLWTEVRGHFWVKGDAVQIDSPSAAWVEQARLPLWDAQWSLGLGYELP